MPPTGQAIADLLRGLAQASGAQPDANGVLDTSSYARTDYCIVHFAFDGAPARYPLDQALIQALAAEWHAEQIGNHVLVIAPVRDVECRQLAENVWGTIVRASATIRDPGQANVPHPQRRSAWKRGDSVAVHYADEQGGMRFIAWIASRDGDEVPAV